MRLLKDKKIGVLFGGVSAEREVSLRSGAAVFNALKAIGYNAVLIDAQKDLCSLLIKEGIEIAFPVLHGGWGENGAVQGMLEVMGIPYTGSGVLASALAMDKEASKQIFMNFKVQVPEFVVIKKPALKYDVPFGMPWVVKPATEGSSIGVTILKEKEKLGAALENAFSFGNRVIVEKYIEGKEVQIGILKNKILGGVEVRPSLEFYSYEAKYTSGLTQYILPPELEQSVYERAAEEALKAHLALGCRGATRVDLRIDNKGNPFVLEVNTIPGMTETSLLPKIAMQAGMNFQELVEEILKSIEDED
ncbi:MAG: D-alanine--D-alanine ligase [Nitrospirae bacterium]|jgi:D-alanine-D-alanine ligase|nr:D-alanine--D-alanine ligase [Nitrospirota bacterium]